jgi:aldehyde:ferredoxin oxidoreductase
MMVANGLAGQNRCFTVSIEQARSGSAEAPFMGDKKIKAVAVRGTKGINLARRAEFVEHMRDATE